MGDGDERIHGYSSMLEVGGYVSTSELLASGCWMECLLFLPLSYVLQRVSTQTFAHEQQWPER
jgi:hypothetical protein